MWDELPVRLLQDILALQPFSKHKLTLQSVSHKWKRCLLQSQSHQNNGEHDATLSNPVDLSRLSVELFPFIPRITFSGTSVLPFGRWDRLNILRGIRLTDHLATLPFPALLVLEAEAATSAITSLSPELLPALQLLKIDKWVDPGSNLLKLSRFRKLRRLDCWSWGPSNIEAPGGCDVYLRFGRVYPTPLVRTSSKPIVASIAQDLTRIEWLLTAIDMREGFEIDLKQFQFCRRLSLLLIDVQWRGNSHTSLTFFNKHELPNVVVVVQVRVSIKDDCCTCDVGSPGAGWVLMPSKDREMVVFHRGG